MAALHFLVHLASMATLNLQLEKAISASVVFLDFIAIIFVIVCRRLFLDNARCAVKSNGN